MPVATATEAPPLDPPGVAFESQGFSVRPCRSFSVYQRIENAGVLVRPSITAPARLRLATTGLSEAATLPASATTPLVVGSPAWSTLILVVIGTPCSSPSGAPAATARSAASAAAMAASACSETTAFTHGLIRSIRSRHESTASRLLMSFARMRSATSVADQRQISSFMESWAPGEGADGKGCSSDAQVMLVDRALGAEGLPVDLVDDRPLLEDVVAVRQVHAETQVLLDEQDRHARIADPSHHLAQLVDDDGGEPLRRLVEQQDPGVVQQRTRNGQHLLLAPRELRAPVALPFG